MPQPIIEATWPEAEVLSHPPIPSFTAFPECLIEKYAGGYRMSWQQRRDQQLSMLRHHHIFPVYVQELGEAIVARLKREGFTRESLKEGMVWNGDCVLCVQPMEAYHLMQRRVDEINARRHATAASKDALEDELQRLAELTGHRTGNRLIHETPYSNTAVADHVAVSKVLRDPSAHRTTPPEGGSEGV